MTGKPAGDGTTHAERGEAMLALVLAVADIFFKMRAAAKETGGVTSWGGGSFGLLESLRAEGPQTVPQLARQRPVARQRIQRLVNELGDAGLVEFVDNPRHKRSRLVALTDKGRAAHREIRGRIVALCEEVAGDFEPAEIVRATRLLSGLATALRARVGSGPDGDGDGAIDNFIVKT